MAGFHFKARACGRHTRRSAHAPHRSPHWQAGDTIPLEADRMLRVIETPFDDPDDPVLVVQLA